MPHRFTMTRRVEFADTDMAGIMHFSNFFRFMENAEHAFYRSLGYSVHPEAREDGRRIGWPRVKAECEFQFPLRFEEEIEIELLVEEVRSRSIRYLFRFWKRGEEGSEPRLAATGRVTVVCVEMDPSEKTMNAVAIPEELRAVIEQAPADLTGALPAESQ